MEEIKRLLVCDRCLRAIESREGNQPTKTIYIDDDAPEEESRCTWCEECGFDVLYEILPD